MPRPTAPAMGVSKTSSPVPPSTLPSRPLSSCEVLSKVAVTRYATGTTLSAAHAASWPGGGAPLVSPNGSVISSAVALTAGVAAARVIG